MRIPAWAMWGAALCCLAPAGARAEDTNASWSRKMVWAHAMVCWPLEFREKYPHHYGECYPLLPPAGSSVPPSDVGMARAAGIDGFAVDIFTTAQWAVRYLEDADRIGGFLIAPCLDLSTSPPERKEADAIKTIRDYCALAGSHPSAAKVEGAFLVFTYGTEQLPPESWQRVRRALADAGCRTYWVVSIDTDGKLVSPKAFPREAILRAVEPFEAGYCFGDARGSWGDVVALFRELGRPFAGGMMPGYFRVAGGDEDPQATARYRDRWQRHLDSGTPWACISTWNDYSENTILAPCSDWSTTRTELTRWYAAAFREERPPFAEPRLYVTTPKAIYPKRAYIAEALALNPTPRPLQVTLRLVDGAGKGVGRPASATVPPGKAGAATVALSVERVPGGRFLRPQAAIRDGARLVASAAGAPVVVLDEWAQPGVPRLYYSVPARAALPGRVRLALSGSPVGGKAKAAITLPAGIRPRFVDLLQNNSLAARFFDRPPFTTDLPAAPAKEVAGGQGWSLSNTDWGFTLARVIDEQGRVGYSDPVFVAPPGDLRTLERYSFEEGTGTTAADASAFRRSATLMNAGWQAPGAAGSRFCIRLSGDRSGVNLTPSLTPAGPMALQMAVRPARFGGLLYGDVGGMILEVRPSGRVAFTRLTPDAPARWCTVEGRTPLPLGEWSTVRATWDGQTSRITVNGTLDGEGPCAAGFTSGRRAIGYNPFQAGSAYFAGDIDDFELSRLR